MFQFSNKTPIIQTTFWLVTCLLGSATHLPPLQGSPERHLVMPQGPRRINRAVIVVYMVWLYVYIYIYKHKCKYKYKYTYIYKYNICCWILQTLLQSPILFCIITYVYIYIYTHTSNFPVNLAVQKKTPTTLPQIAFILQFLIGCCFFLDCQTDRTIWSTHTHIYICANINIYIYIHINIYIYISCID